MSWETLGAVVFCASFLGLMILACGGPGWPE